MDSTSDAALAGSLRPGVVVRAVGLTLNPELNGLLGTCLYLEPNRGRWCVKFHDTDAKKLLRTENLQALADNDDESTSGASTSESGGEDDSAEEAAPSEPLAASTQDLGSLPLLEEVAAPRDLLASLSEELTALRKLHGAELEEYRCKESGAFESRKKEAKQARNAAQQQLRLLEPAVTAKARSHYRHQSALWHPDKAGWAWQDRFHKLTRGMDILMDPILRQMYMNDMDSVRQMCAQLDSMHELLRASHESFMAQSVTRRKAHVDAVEDLERHKVSQSHCGGSIVQQQQQRSKTDAQQQRSKRLGEGGVGVQPSEPRLIRWKANTHVAVVGIKTTHALSQRASQIHLELFRWGAKDEAGKWQSLPVVEGSGLCDHDGRACEKHVNVDVGAFGDFDLRWRCEYIPDGGGMTMLTPWSGQAMLNHVDPSTNMLFHEAELALNEIEKQKTKLLQATGRVERASSRCLEANAEALHQTLKRAIDGMTRSICVVQKARERLQSMRNTSRCQWDFGENVWAEHRLLAKARSALYVVEALSERKAEERAKCVFCDNITERLQQDAFDEWISNLSCDALLPWEVNRMFQLLLEWCKSKVAAGKPFMRVASIYRAAAGRDGLFTSRQCRILSGKAEEFERRHVAAATLIADMERTRAERAARRLEKKAARNLRLAAAAEQACAAAQEQAACSDRAVASEEPATTRPNSEQAAAAEEQDTDTLGRTLVADNTTAEAVGNAAEMELATEQIPQSLPLHSPARQGCSTMASQVSALRPLADKAGTTSGSESTSLPVSTTAACTSVAAVDGANVDCNELRAFMDSLDLSKYTAKLESEEMYLDVMSELDPEELESSLKELSLPMGARRKIAKALGVRMGDGATGLSSGKPSRDAPPEFNCPITMALMHDPVVSADGHTYDRKAIESWLLKNSTSPVTGLPLPHRTLVTNWNLRSQIQRFRTL